jgi:hypothetical protein
VAAVDNGSTERRPPVSGAGVLCCSQAGFISQKKSQAGTRGRGYAGSTWQCAISMSMQVFARLKFQVLFGSDRAVRIGRLPETVNLRQGGTGVVRTSKII